MMDRAKQLQLFAADLDALCKRYGENMDITGVEAAGVLFCKAQAIAAAVNRPIPPPAKQDGQPEGRDP
jgi:hypothetical protein